MFFQGLALVVSAGSVARRGGELLREGVGEDFLL